MPFFLSHPAAAWLLPAVALPIAFHLFFRLRRQVREFPSLMLFLRIDPRLSAKRKIHEWLLLLLRCLFLLLLLLALARPLLGLKSSGEKVARLILIDNSGSMAALAAPGVSKLALAQRAAEKLIAASRLGDSIAVQLMTPDPTVALPHGFDAAPAVLRDGVGQLTPTDAGASVPKAIRLAFATLDSAKTLRRELHILTDLQQKNWSRGEVKAVANAARLIVHRIDSAPLSTGSVSIELLESPARAIPAGRVIPVRVTLQNRGPVAAHVRLDSTDDSGKNGAQDVEVAPGASTPVSLTFSFPQSGFHWAQVWLEGDAAPAANRAEIGFWETDVRKMLFVGGKEDFAAMPYAVSPGGGPALSGIDATVISEAQLAAGLEAQPLAVALTWENWPQDEPTSQALQDYVRRGGTLFLVPSPDAGVSIARPAAAWLDASLGGLLTPKDAEPLVLLQEGDPLWRDLRDSDGRPQLGLPRAFQYCPVQTGADWQVLVASSSGATLFARRHLGQGSIFVSGLAFAPAWSSLPLKGGFVVLMQSAIFGDQTEQIPVQQIQAGGEFHFDFPGEQAAVKSLAGSALDWHGNARDFDGLPRAGVYEISQRDHVGWVAASGDADEADLHFLPPGQVPLLRNVPHEVVPLVHEDDILRSEQAQGPGLPLYRWLLLLALLVLLAETWTAAQRSSDWGKKLFSSLLPSAAPGKKAAPGKPAEPTPV